MARRIGGARSTSVSPSDLRSGARSGRRPLNAGTDAEARAAADPDATTDAALIARVRQGDVAAYATVVHRHMRSAFGIAYHVLQHREDAEDVVQQAFMAALARLDTFDVARPFGPWFGRVVLNHARSARRSRDRVWRRSSEPAELLETAPGSAPDRLAEDSEIRSRVQAAMSMLPDRQRLAIQLIEIDGYTPAEVATMLDLAPVTMRWHLMAARRTLRRLLAPLAPLTRARASDRVSDRAGTALLPGPEIDRVTGRAGTEPREARDVRGE